MLAASAQAQTTNPMQFQRWNTFNVNRVSTQFSNTGLLADGNEQNRALARKPAFEFPIGSQFNYGTSVGVVFGAPAAQDPGAVRGSNPDQLPYLDATLDEGSAAFWADEHFAPYAETAGVERAPMSTDPASWPTWPGTYPETSVPLLVGSEGWPGFGDGGERIADQESFSVAYAWQGPDNYNPDGSLPRGARWLPLQIVTRGLAWEGTLYENFLLFSYDVRNLGTAPIRDLRAGIHADLGFLPIATAPSFADADRHYYDPALQLAYGWDDNSFEESPVTGAGVSGDDIAWGGVMVLEMPGPDPTVATYDAFHFWIAATTPAGNGAGPDLYYFYNLVNENDPHDSNNDGIDDDFDGDGVPDAENGGPGYYLGEGGDGLQTLGSHPFTLDPGATERVVFAVVFGATREALFTNARRAKQLYESGYQVVRAPEAPVVEAIAENGRVELYWDLRAEDDELFEGYKIYRSPDDGQTYGTRTFTDFAGGLHFVPLAQFDLANGISGNYRALPEFAWFDLGDDTGLPRTVVVDAALAGRLGGRFAVGDTLRTYVDNEAVNGQRYRYYVAAYDSDNGITGPLENTPVAAADQLAAPNNTVEVVPQATLTGEPEGDRVRVVPNPYVVANAFERSGSRQLQFTRVPEQCTIRILNAAGETVRVIEHTGEGTLAPNIATWDLLNDNRQLAAPGLYLFLLNAPDGTAASGKFIIVH